MKHYDLAVVGAGHAGVEAALASARMGLSVLLMTLDRRAVGRMSCNPAIGGLAKGHLVREIDALGGEMGRAADATGIHYRMLNRSRGAAVQGPRAQADRERYAAYMLRAVEGEGGIDLLESEAADLLVASGCIEGLVTAAGERIGADAVILTAGTFLSARMYVGEKCVAGGRRGERAAERLGGRMRRIGFRTARLKTGTPPRILRKSINWEKTTEQKPDLPPRPFSFRTEKIDRAQISCWITGTTEETHDTIRRNIHRSPMHSGRIEGTGPRYCPSIEDKVVRFSQQSSHHVFLEAEGRGSDLVYPNGLSTSLPEEAQLELLRTIPGLEECDMVTSGYAVEYDFFPTDQIRRCLETTLVERLYLAGQVNGTSGYEEAAAQGLMAGINATRKLRGEDPLVLSRCEAYIGVLIDDLITCIPKEPYRMFTSRAEHRLLLRHDTADIRLASIGVELGLLAADVAERAESKDRDAAREIAFLERTPISRERANRLLAGKGGAPLQAGTRLAALLRRPEIRYDDVIPFRNGAPLPSLPVREEAEIRLKYAGYVQRQRRLVERVARMERRPIPEPFDFEAIRGLSREGGEKLARHRPETVGVASRIDGVTPADLSLLVVHLDRRDRQGISER